MGSVLLDFDTYKVRRPDLSQAFMDGKISVRKKGKRNLVIVSEYSDFKWGIAGTNTYHLDFAFRLLTFFNDLI